MPKPRFSKAYLASGKKISLHKYSSAEAWINLTKNQKEALRELRMQGMFGGTPGKAPYFWAQSGLDADAAEKAGITPKPFIHQAASQFDRYQADIFAAL